MRKNKSSTLPLPVDEDNYWDRLVKELTKKGLFGKAIARLTNLTPSQVSYRWKALNVSPMDYRRGESPEVKRAVAEIRDMLNQISHLQRSRSAARRSRKHRELEKQIIGSGGRKASD